MELRSLYWKTGAYLGGVTVLVLVPFLLSAEFFLHVAILILIWAMLCLSLNIIFGYTGQLSLAHGGLFGTGAYVYGILSITFSMNFWLAFLIAGLSAGIVGLLIGIPSLRLRGPYFVIVTMGFNIILVAIIRNLRGLTGGVNGLIGIPGPSNICTPFFTIGFESKISKYYLILIFFMLFWFIAYRIRNWLSGRCLVAIKEDEELCQSVGINTMFMKVQSFVVSSILAGISGALYASYIGLVVPHDASFHIGFDALVYLTVGGIGTLLGTIIGPALMIVISELFQYLAEGRLLLNGAILVVLIIFMPQGITGGILSVWKKMRGVKES